MDPSEKTITQWVDGCAKAFIYGGENWCGEWGVWDGRSSAREQLDELKRKGLNRSEGYERISQSVFGFGNGAKHVVVTDVQVSLCKHKDTVFGECIAEFEY
ncbi:hypothetical protein QFC20_004069 [Naganishia adeliensis]|uniref:Uncharacterized protein n=1 Tax=Naganishia adeliensis TaxID=92952 RepID=A0ACC2W7J3_9TREE|nr:hypothetical protein QFC20_004069 [Naganishia adeliensis]